MAQKTGTGTGTGADVCTIAPESVGTAARHRPTKAVGECAGGCIGSAVRKDHDLLKVKNQALELVVDEGGFGLRGQLSAPLLLCLGAFTSRVP